MSQGPHVALFVTCLVDLYRPSVGFAAVRLLTSCTSVTARTWSGSGQDLGLGGEGEGQ